MSKVAKYSPRGIVVKAATAEITNCGFGVSRNMLISSFNRCDSAKASRRRVKGRERRDGEIGEHVITIRDERTHFTSKGTESALNDRSNRSNQDIVHAGPRTPVQHEPRLGGAKSIYGDWKLPASTWPSLMRADPEIVHEILFAFWGPALPVLRFHMLAL